MKIFFSLFIVGALLGITGLSASATTSSFDDSATLYISSEAESEIEDGHIGVAFVLDATKSVDDGTISRFIWKQVKGPVTVSISNAGTNHASFVPSAAGTYVFELTVTDSAGKSHVAKRIEVLVEPLSIMPISAPTGSAEAGSALIEFDTIKGESSESKKGKVEMEWKVEDGTKVEEGRPEGIDDEDESDRATKSGVLLGGSDDDSLKSESDDNSGTEDSDKSDSESKGNKDDSISVDGDDIDGLTDEEKQQLLSIAQAHAEVRSEQDLINFATGILVENANMEEISFHFEKIEMSHRAEGKLFGFIPVKLMEKVEVETEGESIGKVKVKYAWFGFLVSKEVKATDIETAIKAEISTNLGANENWNFGDKALSVSLISNVLKTKHDTAKNSVGNIR